MLPGVQYTGNFGCVHNFQRKHLRQITKQIVVINLKASQCHLGIVSNLTIHVSNAKKTRIVLINIIFVAQQETQTPILAVQLSLPTPVKLQLLAKFLFDYQPDVVQSIIFGFSIGFPLHFQGRRQFSIPNNFFLSFTKSYICRHETGKRVGRRRYCSLFAFHLPNS